MNTALTKFKIYASCIIGISCVIEIAFFFSLENIFAAFSLFSGWLLLAAVTLTPKNLKYYPASFIMLLGMSIFYFLLPLPLTLLELKPVTYNLRVPFSTFFHHLLFAATIVLTHKIYTSFSKRNNIFRTILRATNFYTEPTNEIIWVTSLFGLGASFYNYFIMGIWEMDTLDRSPLYHIMTILSAYIWMPLVILFPKFRSNQLTGKRNATQFVALYSIFVFIIAIASNWRTILFSGIFIVIGLFGFGLLLQHFSFRTVITPKRLVIFLAAFFFVTGPLLDFAQAMVIVRGERSNVSATELMSRTFDVYANKDELDKVRKSTFTASPENPYSSYDWNESYLSNIMLNRMVNLKISDNCLYYASEIGYQNSNMQAEILNQIKAFMPNIFLSIFNINIEDKIFTSTHSIGDYLYGLAINSSSELGSAIVSSVPGVGMAIFGYWYILIVVPLFIIIFAMFDSFIDYRNGKIIFSFMFFLSFAIMLNYFNDRHVFVFEFRYIVRSYFESVVVFLMTITTINFFLNGLLRNIKKRGTD